VLVNFDDASNHESSQSVGVKDGLEGKKVEKG